MTWNYEFLLGLIQSGENHDTVRHLAIPCKFKHICHSAGQRPRMANFFRTLINHCCPLDFILQSLMTTAMTYGTWCHWLWYAVRKLGIAEEKKEIILRNFYEEFLDSEICGNFNRAFGSVMVWMRRSYHPSVTLCVCYTVSLVAKPCLFWFLFSQ